MTSLCINALIITLEVEKKDEDVGNAGVWHVVTLVERRLVEDKVLINCHFHTNGNKFGEKYLSLILG